MDRRCCITYLQELIQPQLLPGGRLDDVASWQQPALQLAPGFAAPLPASFERLADYIEAALPSESPLMYGMHPNAGVLLSTSLGETLFKTVTEVSGGATGELPGLVWRLSLLQRAAAVASPGRDQHQPARSAAVGVPCVLL